MDPVVHFELPFDDRERIARFYREVFGCGGETLGEPMLIPGIGDYVSFFDTEKNRLSMLQPLPMA